MQVFFWTAGGCNQAASVQIEPRRAASQASTSNELRTKLPVLNQAVSDRSQLVRLKQSWLQENMK